MAAVVAPFVAPALDLAKDLIDRIFPDKTAQAAQRAEALQHLDDLAQQRWSATLQASSQADAGQIDIDKVEAASTSLWKSGWRPGIGWVGVVALFTYYVPYCLLATILWAHQAWVTKSLPPRPDLGIADLVALISILLGGSTLRSMDKWRDKA